MAGIENYIFWFVGGFHLCGEIPLDNLKDINKSGFAGKGNKSYDD